jgi:hypothetical protein
MLNSEKILAALKQFDPTNAAYGTEDGLPVLEAVQHLAGDQTLTREMVTSVAPGFTRTTPALDVGIVASEQQAPAEPATQGPTLSQPPAEKAPVQEQLESTVVKRDSAEVYANELDRLKARSAELKADMVYINSDRDKLQKALDKLAAEEESLDRKIRSLERGDKTMQALEQYRNSQLTMLAQRTEKLGFLKEHSAVLGQILKTKAPIDQAMARKNTRGTQRPGG